MRIVGISGGLTALSRTRALVEFVVKQALSPLPLEVNLIDVADLVPELGMTRAREEAPPLLEAVLEKVEMADLLVVGTPIYNGSYTGLLKHLLDLLVVSNAEERVAIIVATDPGDCNSLVLEHSLRPLLNLLGYRTVPTAVYARDSDFVNLWVAEEAVMTRARRAVREAFYILGLDPPLSTFVHSANSLRASD